TLSLFGLEMNFGPKFGFFCPEFRITTRSSSSPWTWEPSRGGWRTIITGGRPSACRTSTPCSPTATSTTRYQILKIRPKMPRNSQKSSTKIPPENHPENP
uniref:Uncharacterized protein n=1 Tax=Geospiza parvula TaxID=87175 RepID=A0A8U8AUI4_GEOPR